MYPFLVLLRAKMVLWIVKVADPLSKPFSYSCGWTLGVIVLLKLFSCGIAVVLAPSIVTWTHFITKCVQGGTRFVEGKGHFFSAICSVSFFHHHVWQKTANKTLYNFLWSMTSSLPRFHIKPDLWSARLKVIVTTDSPPAPSCGSLLLSIHGSSSDSELLARPERNSSAMHFHFNLLHYGMLAFHIKLK